MVYHHFLVKTAISGCPSFSIVNHPINQPWLGVTNYIIPYNYPIINLYWGLYIIGFTSWCSFVLLPAKDFGCRTQASLHWPWFSRLSAAECRYRIFMKWHEDVSNTIPWFIIMFHHFLLRTANIYRSLEGTPWPTVNRGRLVQHWKPSWSATWFICQS
jgi:hypothetical protein